MRPYKDINVGDVYKEPFTGSEWLVLDKDDDEKMVKVVMLANLPPALKTPFWKEYKFRLFAHRVYAARRENEH